jgi:hypothetical protein
VGVVGRRRDLGRRVLQRLQDRLDTTVGLLDGVHELDLQHRGDRYPGYLVLAVPVLLEAYTRLRVAATGDDTPGVDRLRIGLAAAYLADALGAGP